MDTVSINPLLANSKDNTQQTSYSNHKEVFTNPESEPKTIVMKGVNWGVGGFEGHASNENLPANLEPVRHTFSLLVLPSKIHFMRESFGTKYLLFTSTDPHCGGPWYVKHLF